MDAKTYLSQVEILDAKISSKIDDLQNLRDMITRITPALRQDAGSGGGFTDDKLGAAVAKIVDLQDEINQDIDALVDARRSVSTTLDAIDDPDQFYVLHKRYFDYESFEQIAVEMSMTYRNVCYIHGKALQSVERMINNGNDEV